MNNLASEIKSKLINNKDIDDNHRDYKVYVRCTKEEKAKVQLFAKAMHMKVSEYIRYMAITLPEDIIKDED